MEVLFALTICPWTFVELRLPPFLRGRSLCIVKFICRRKYLFFRSVSISSYLLLNSVHSPFEVRDGILCTLVRLLPNTFIGSIGNPVPPLLLSVCLRFCVLFYLRTTFLSSSFQLGEASKNLCESLDETDRQPFSVPFCAIKFLLLIFSPPAVYIFS